MCVCYIISKTQCVQKHGNLSPSSALQVHGKHMGLVGSPRACHLWLPGVGSDAGRLRSSTHRSHCWDASDPRRWLRPKLGNNCRSQIRKSEGHGGGGVLSLCLFSFHADVVSEGRSQRRSYNHLPGQTLSHPSKQ